MRLMVVSASKSFKGRNVFAGLDAVFPGHRVSALVGPSGSGKSTLLAVLAGLERLERGEVLLQMSDGSQRRPASQDFVWVAQSNSALPARTAIENVMIGALANGASISDAYKTANAKLRLVDLTHRSNDPVKTLSGGERQRVGLARALAAERSFILADEPTSNLDAANTRRIAELLAALRNTATIIVATHDPIVIESAENVVTMRPAP